MNKTYMHVDQNNRVHSFDDLLTHVENEDRDFVGSLLLFIETIFETNSVLRKEKPSIELTNKALYIVTYVLDVKSVIKYTWLQFIKLFCAYKIDDVTLTISKTESEPVWRMYVQIRRASSPVKMTTETIVAVQNLFESGYNLNNFFKDGAQYNNSYPTSKKRKLN